MDITETFGIWIEQNFLNDSPFLDQGKVIVENIGTLVRIFNNSKSRRVRV